MQGIVPAGYLHVREAIFALAAVRYAGTPLKEAVLQARQEGADSRFTREQLEATAADLWAEIDAGRLSVSIEHMTSGGLLNIDPGLLTQIPFLRRFSVSDLSYLRPADLLSYNLARRFPRRPRQTFAKWIGQFQLLVSRDDLDRVQVKFRQTRKRRLSRPPTGRPPGRPNRAAKIKPLVREAVEQGRWRFPQTLKALSNIVTRTATGPRVSDSTVARALDELFEETADNRYSRPRKVHARADDSFLPC